MHRTWLCLCTLLNIATFVEYFTTICLTAKAYVNECGGSLKLACDSGVGCWRINKTTQTNGCSVLCSTNTNFASSQNGNCFAFAGSMNTINYLSSDTCIFCFKSNDSANININPKVYWYLNDDCDETYIIGNCANISIINYDEEVNISDIDNSSHYKHNSKCNNIRRQVTSIPANVDNSRLSGVCNSKVVSNGKSFGTESTVTGQVDSIDITNHSHDNLIFYCDNTDSCFKIRMWYNESFNIIRATFLQINDCINNFNWNCNCIMTCIIIITWILSLQIIMYRIGNSHCTNIFGIRKYNCNINNNLIGTITTLISITSTASASFNTTSTNSDTKSTNTFWEDNENYLIIGGAILGVLSLCVLIFCAYRCGQKKERRKAVQAKLDAIDSSAARSGISSRTITKDISLASEKMSQTIEKQNSLPQINIRNENDNEIGNTNYNKHGRKSTDLEVDYYAASVKNLPHTSTNLSNKYPSIDSQTHEIEIAVVRNLADIDINEIGGDLANLVGKLDYKLEHDENASDIDNIFRVSRVRVFSTFNNDNNENNGNNDNYDNKNNDDNININININRKDTGSTLPSLPMEKDTSQNTVNNKKRSMTVTTNRVVIIDPSALNFRHEDDDDDEDNEDSSESQLYTGSQDIGNENENKNAISGAPSDHKAILSDPNDDKNNNVHIHQRKRPPPPRPPPRSKASRPKPKPKPKAKAKPKLEARSKIESSSIKSKLSQNKKTYKSRRMQNYEFWKIKHVLLWIKINLLKNGFNGKMIDPFLKEFETKKIVGTSLIKFKLDPQSLETFIQGFSKPHQNDAFWVIIRSAILALPTSESK